MRFEGVEAICAFYNRCRSRAMRFHFNRSQIVDMQNKQKQYIVYSEQKKQQIACHVIEAST